MTHCWISWQRPRDLLTWVLVMLKSFSSQWGSSFWGPLSWKLVFSASDIPKAPCSCALPILNNSLNSWLPTTLQCYQHLVLFWVLKFVRYMNNSHPWAIIVMWSHHNPANPWYMSKHLVFFSLSRTSIDSLPSHNARRLRLFLGSLCFIVFHSPWIQLTVFLPIMLQHLEFFLAHSIMLSHPYLIPL